MFKSPWIAAGRSAVRGPMVVVSLMHATGGARQGGALHKTVAALAKPPILAQRKALARGGFGGSDLRMAKTEGPITIKKYANRRLYNTGTSTYVTLEDLATMVKTGEDFVVYDAKTGEDITRSVLTQIIFEQENKEGQNLLPINFLRQLIRFYGDSMQMLVPRYLEVSIDSLTREQEKFREQMAQAFGIGGFGPIEDQVRRNMEMFERTFAMFAPFASNRNGITNTSQPKRTASKPVFIGSAPARLAAAKAPIATGGVIIDRQPK
jgi:polyhydroxyalkanoate synthesis repressor PhaR